MPDLIERFGASYFTMNSISERRQGYAIGALRRYEESLSKPIEQADDADLRAYLVELKRDLQASTVNWHLTMIKPFYRWCYQERVIDAEHLMRIDSVKPPRGYNGQLPKPYSRRELRELWAALDARWPKLPINQDQRSTFNRWRNGQAGYRRVKKHAMRLQLEAMIELALVCGLRKVEIYRLSIDDCHWDNAYIVVHGKRVNQHDKVREVPFPDSTRAAVREWFRMRGMMGAAHGSLWLSVTGPDPIAPLGWDRMHDLLAKALGPGWEWHRLRHTCATERLRAKMPIEKLQQFLGHANINQTLAYTKLLRDDVHQATARTEDDFQRAIHAAA